MWQYVTVKDELGEAEEEVYELARLLREAQARRDRLMAVAPHYTWTEYILHMLGFQIKSN